MPHNEYCDHFLIAAVSLTYYLNRLSELTFLPLPFLPFGV